MEESKEDCNSQSFDGDAQNLLKTALKDPSSVDLEKISNIIVDQSLKDLVFTKEAGRMCFTIVQAEANQSSGNVFRTNLLNRLQQEFNGRQKMRENSLKEWISYVTLICNIFDCVKVNGLPMVALVHPIYDCLMMMCEADALLNEEEVKCLVTQLHRIGEQLEKMNLKRMDELFFLLRDGFFMQNSISSLGRLLLLEILEFRAGGWMLSETSHEYYYSELGS